MRKPRQTAARADRINAVNHAINMTIRDAELIATRPAPELLPAVHRSAQPHRLRKVKRNQFFGLPTTGNAERIYAAHWLRENKHYHILAHILAPDLPRPFGVHLGPPPPVSRRDAIVAASVIQWLATNVGHGFILEAERAVGREDVRQARRAADDLERRTRNRLREEATARQRLGQRAVRVRA